jgi:hypothetical protein
VVELRELAYTRVISRPVSRSTTMFWLRSIVY